MLSTYLHKGSYDVQLCVVMLSIESKVCQMLLTKVKVNSIILLRI